MRHSDRDASRGDFGCGTVIALAIWLVAVWLASAADAATYHRSERTVTLKHAVRPVTLARSRTPEDSDTARYLVANEIAALARCEPNTVMPAGKRVRLPRYTRVNRTFNGTLRDWHLAVLAGNKYGVAPSLLVAIRSHENPSPAREAFGYGVMHCKWTSLRRQSLEAAKIVARIARRQGWDPDDPTRGNIASLGRAYADGSTEWGRCVHAIRQRILRGVD